MALGTLGSTLNDELNRLANGGTYRDKSAMVDEALAAKQWANRENINPYSTDTVGVLNEIAGLGLDKRNWLDFNGVCNYIAGTTGLPAAAALRQVYPTTDLLTSQASYYVDAATPRYNYPGYLYFTGVSGLSTPDATALDITGNIDLRARIAPDDWTPAATGFIFAKWTGGSNYSYVFSLESNGTLGFFYSTDGTVGTANFKYSTVATGVADGATKWVRVTRSSSTGNIIFYLSDDGSTWTQLGTTVTSTPSSMFSGTANLGIMINSAGSTENVVGRIYNAQIFASLDGTDKRLDVDLSANVTSATYNQFTATTGQLMTIVGQNTLTNGGAAGSLLPTTVGSSTAADSNDPKFLSHTGTNYVYTTGVSGNAISVPDATNLRITGDIDIRTRVALDDWTPPSVSEELVSKRGAAGNRGYMFRVRTTGLLNLTWSPDGTAEVSVDSTIAPTVADGGTLWVRATLDVDNGAGTPQYEVDFYTSTDGLTWTPLGSKVTGSTGVTSIYPSTAIVVDNGGSTFKTGKVFNIQIYSDITETTKVLDVDTSVITAGSATSFTAVTGQTVTINRSTSGRKTVAVTQPTWLFGTDDYMEVNNRYMSSGTYLYLPGIGGNSASTPDAAALDITGDLDLRVKVALDDWTPAASTTLLAKYGASGNRSYLFTVSTAGNLVLNWSVDGTSGTELAKTSTVATGITDGSVKWVRVVLDVDNGSSGNTVRFYTSSDGSTWTDLGDPVVTAGTTSIYASAQLLEIGQWNTNSPARGKFFRTQVLNGIDGTVAFDANFETSITSLLQTSFTESSTNAATVTINRSGSTYRSAGITAAGYLYPGATNTFSASATDFLNFGASDSFTAVFVGRLWVTPVSTRQLFGKAYSGAPFSGWGILNQGTTTQGRLYTTDSSGTSVSSYGSTPASGTLQTIAGILNRSVQLSTVYTNSTAGTSVSTSSVNNLSTIIPARIGSWSDGALTQDTEIIAAALFRTALTASQIRQITNYFANREVYL